MRVSEFGGFTSKEVMTPVVALIELVLAFLSIRSYSSLTVGHVYVGAYLWACGDDAFYFG